LEYQTIATLSLLFATRERRNNSIAMYHPALRAPLHGGEFYVPQFFSTMGSSPPSIESNYSPPVEG
jgi:hypothetical protein